MPFMHRKNEHRKSIPKYNHTKKGYVICFKKHLRSPLFCHRSPYVGKGRLVYFFPNSSSNLNRT